MKKLAIFTTLFASFILCLHGRDFIRTLSCFFYDVCYLPYNSYCNGEGLCITTVYQSGGWINSELELYIYSGIKDFIPGLDEGYIRPGRRSNYCAQSVGGELIFYFDVAPAINNFRQNAEIVIGGSSFQKCLTEKHLAPY